MSDKLTKAIYQISEGLRMLAESLDSAPEELLQEEPKTAPKKQAAPKKQVTDNEPPVSLFKRQAQAQPETQAQQITVTQAMVRDAYKAFAGVVGAATAPQQAKAILDEVGVPSTAEANPEQLGVIYSKMQEVVSRGTH